MMTAIFYTSGGLFNHFLNLTTFPNYISTRSSVTISQGAPESAASLLFTEETSKENVSAMKKMKKMSLRLQCDCSREETPRCCFLWRIPV